MFGLDLFGWADMLLFLGRVVIKFMLLIFVALLLCERI